MGGITSVAQCMTSVREVTARRHRVTSLVWVCLAVLIDPIGGGGVLIRTTCCLVRVVHRRWLYAVPHVGPEVM